MSHKSKKILVSLALALGLSSSMSTGVRADETSPALQQAKPPVINVTPAVSDEMVATLTVTGTIVPRQEVAVGTDVAGLLVLELNSDQGDVVKEGDILARLDKSSLQIQLAQIEAQRAQADASIAQSEAQIVDAEIAVRQAQEALDRARALSLKGINSKMELDNATNAHDSAKARLNTAHQALIATQSQLQLVAAQKRDVQLRLEKADVRAPTSGVVLSRSALLGGIVSANAGPLFRIARDREFELAANIPEVDLPRLKEGMPVAVRVSGMNEPVSGRVRLISPEISASSRLGSVKITLERNASIRPGNFARATIELTRREGVSVPLSAVVYRGTSALVQVVKDGVIESRDVELGIRDHRSIEVLQGLAEGEDVVARAGTFVANGDRVTPIRMNDEATGAIK
ncbi:efflux RND transporter periplasmic adaptor subunit [Phyllobacterium endophyticum]|uniref:Efflux RND transporter periplasmic adaptor subunit n=1 Tax=Phyllobacterium endophyticum TaxID=1149773 RepID=A0A2P7AWF2_9HYPH|nr:efflux RND transporter periplasmic adaptor subunit [Phyllobacterium endophyticum]MBB3235145.1 HlyD family secretion protein [Phyllobacterium endophyticum]PSH58533.1 efflux RND transporter periplasmic adaptor subunit [Phyllobacterium endophyticum]TYR39212.1 efflux RND transporter periplasmic adaptor subunit [Phyllobacterium endophyticum]